MRQTILRNAAAGTAALVFLSLVILIAEAQPPAAKGGKGAPKGEVTGRLTWFDREGKASGTMGEAAGYRTLSVSPDGKQVAVERTEAETGNRDIWVFEAGGGKGTRLTSDPGWDAFPVWSPDGKRIVFTSNRGGAYDLYQKASNGSGNEELLYRSGEGKGPTDWSRDGRFLVYYSLGQPTHLRLLAVTGPPDRKPVPVVDDTQFSSVSARFSPDGRWIAYSSNESGSNEVSVRPFDPSVGSAGKPTVVSKNGGRAPLWRGDSKELYYIAGDGTATAVDVRVGSAFATGTPRPLFKVPEAVLFWDASPDGTRFVFPVSEPRP
jgi:Tol biopolymer transport system component